MRFHANDNTSAMSSTSSSPLVETSSPPCGSLLIFWMCSVVVTITGPVCSIEVVGASSQMLTLNGWRIHMRPFV